MAKVKVELEHTDWQVMLMLIGQGYNGVCARLNEQLVAANQPPPPADVKPQGNGDARSDQPQ
jgi:hypothetical protein